MKFSKTPLKDAWVIELEPKSDDRGYFARAFCKNEFDELGIESNVVQVNVSFNHKAGTLRGMHYQKEPAQETKIIRCTQGAIYDVIIDLRKDSPTYMQHFGIELSAQNMLKLFVPRGFGHGYLTLEDNTEARYMVSEFYTPELEAGVRYDDPVFGIEWPIPISVISEKDARWPLYNEA
ncbi:MAG: dTDP-4-dehydrorhamnose 3,5-epimerase [Verrucomicrobiota bacterium]